MRFDKLEYVATGVPQAPDVLTIEANGSARYESHSNEATPDRPEIGTYQTALPADEMQALGKLLDNPPFQIVPDHWGKVVSGESSRRIRITAGQEKIEKFIAFRAPIDPAMLRAMAALDQIIAKVKSHPRHTLRVQLTQAAVAADKTLTAHLSFSNTGVEPVNVRSPLAAMAGEGCRLTFETWPDKARSDVRPEDAALVNVVGVEPLPPTAGPANTQPCLTLAPRASAAFLIRATVAARHAGPYFIRARYENFGGEAGGSPLLVGELYSQAVRVTVPQSAP